MSERGATTEHPDTWLGYMRTQYVVCQVLFLARGRKRPESGGAGGPGGAAGGQPKTAHAMSRAVSSTGDQRPAERGGRDQRQQDGVVGWVAWWSLADVAWPPVPLLLWLPC